ASRAKAQDEEYDEWLSALDPTMPSSGEGPNRSCYTCAFTSTCRPPDLNSQCGPLNSCIERHCLCDDCFSSESSSGPDLCGCFETCIPSSDMQCWSQWRDYLACVSRECDGPCN